VRELPSPFTALATTASRRTASTRRSARSRSTVRDAADRSRGRAPAAEVPLPPLG